MGEPLFWKHGFKKPKPKPKKLWTKDIHRLRFNKVGASLDKLFGKEPKFTGRWTNR